MKVCSLYGAGFYYMPGTDICIKIGGFVRAQYYYGFGSTGTFDNFVNSASYQDRFAGDNQDSTFRVRTVVTLDTRQQTEFGTLRTYTLFGFNHDNNPGAGPALYANRGFIQLAGFTLGKAQSFYDIFSNPAVSYFGIPGSDTGDGGVLLAAYTAQFGNGFSGTISLEDPVNRRTVINEAGAGGFAPAIGAFNTNRYANVNAPDIVGAIRLDQAWGSAQVMAAGHQVRADYYNPSDIAVGHPDDKWGFVVGGGAIINTPFISPGDKFQFQVNYTEGALKYLDQVEAASNYAFISGSELGVGLMSDAVYSSLGGGLDLTKGWEISASYDHVWNQRWKTSVYGGYMKVEYGDTANALICGPAFLAAGCNNNWNTAWVGTRTQFNINSSTYLGLDLLYNHLTTADNGNAILGPSTIGYTDPGHGHVGNYTLADQDSFSATFRVHRDFLP